jgi:CRP/FNR family cyclic AMP-dependent transcriptional regulator
LRGGQQTIHLLRLIPYFAALSPDELATVAGCLVERRLESGQMGFLEGEAGAGLFLVVKGQAKIFRMSTEGREQVLSLLYPGDSCNEVPVVDGGTNPATFAAIEPTTVWIWTAETMDYLRREIPRLDGTIITSLAGRCRELVDKVYDLSFRSVTARLAGFLLEQAAQSSDTNVDRRRWTQEEMAAHIGTVREMVGRALRNLERDGLIRFDRNRIEIADRDGLESLL